MIFSKEFAILRSGTNVFIVFIPSMVICGCAEPEIQVANSEFNKFKNTNENPILAYFPLALIKKELLVTNAISLVLETFQVTLPRQVTNEILSSELYSS